MDTKITPSKKKGGDLVYVRLHNWTEYKSCDYFWLSVLWLVGWATGRTSGL